MWGWHSVALGQVDDNVRYEVWARWISKVTVLLNVEDKTFGCTPRLCHSYVL
jgi:Fe-S cluster biosynthesis and repair protein YggX